MQKTSENDIACDIIFLVRPVFDTSALVSALRSSEGASAELIRLAVAQRLVFLLDYKLLCEYRDVTLRLEQLREMGRSGEEVEAVICMIEAIAEGVSVRFKHRPLSTDANDDLVLDVAINGQANVIVTHNFRHFSRVAASFGIETLTPREFLARWYQREVGNAKGE